MSSQSFPLPENHGWNAPPGYNVIVLDRGAARFDVPAGWHVSHGQDSLKFQDAPPPNDECSLEVSMRRLSGVAIDAVPMEEMLRTALGAEQRCGPMRRERRANHRLVWTHYDFHDSALDRGARCRCALGLAANLHVFLTLAYWHDDAQRCEAVWDQVVRSLNIGLLYRDPASGIPVDPTRG